MSITGRLSPTDEGDFHTDWQFPTKAYVSDDDYAKETNPGEHHDWNGFDMSGIPADAIIDEIKVYVEGYVDDDTDQFVHMGYKKDGAEITAWSFDCGFTNTDAEHLVLTIPNIGEDKALWVNLRIGLNYTELGGCLAADQEIEMWNGDSVRADRVKIGDEVRSYDFKTRKWVKGKIVDIKVYEGSFDMIKFYTLKPDNKSISDICVSTTHPLWINNKKKYVEARGVKKGDFLTDIWIHPKKGKKLYPVPVLKIKKLKCDKKYDIKCEPKIFFAGEKLGKTKG